LYRVARIEFLKTIGELEYGKGSGIQMIGEKIDDEENSVGEFRTFLITGSPVCKR
jgi:hypothetical protein